MILVVDMGNTHTVLGGYEGERLVFELRMATNRKATSDEWGLTVLQLLERQKVDVSSIHGIAYASVVPQLEWAMQNADPSRRARSPPRWGQRQAISK